MSGRGAGLDSLSNSSHSLNTLRTRSSKIQIPEWKTSRRDRFKAFLSRVGSKYDQHRMSTLGATSTTSLVAAASLAAATGSDPMATAVAGVVAADIAIAGNLIMQNRKAIKKVLSKANEKFERFVRKISDDAMLSLNVGTITMSVSTIAGMSPVKSISLAAANGTGFFVGTKLSDMKSQRKIKKARRAAEQARAEKKAEDEILSDFYKN